MNSSVAHLLSVLLRINWCVGTTIVWSHDNAPGTWMLNLERCMVMAPEVASLKWEEDILSVVFFGLIYEMGRNGKVIVLTVCFVTR